MLVLTANVSCKRDIGELDSVKQKVITLKKLDDLYYKYVSGDRDTAAQSLLSGISLLESASCLEKRDRAQLLNLEYSRLAVMEHKLGEKEAEEAYLLCSQYWQLKMYESSNEPIKQVMEKVRQLNIQDEMALVEKMDKKLHGGNLADYNLAK